MTFRVAAKTNRGGRESNQDACVLVEELARAGVIVCDGLGAYADSRYASHAVARSLATCFMTQEQAPSAATVEHWVHTAHETLSRAKLTQVCKSAATTVCAIFADGGKAVACSVGDTRLYRVREGSVSLLTEDDSLARLSADSAYESFIPERNQLLAAVGMGKLRTVHTLEIELKTNDRYLICTDGFWQHFKESELLKRGDADSVLDWYTAHLTKRAGNNSDNYTLAILDVKD